MHSGIEIGLKKHATILDQPRKKRLGSTTTQHAYSPSLPFLPAHLSHIEASKPRKKDRDLGRSTNLVVLLGGFFSRCSSCSQHAPVHHFASWATSRGLPTFLDPRGPRAHISCSPIRLSSP